MKQKRKTSQKWRKEMNEIISREMYFGENHDHDQLEKANRELKLRWLKRVVKDWEISDVERVDDVLRHRRECDSDVFSRQFYQVIYPLLRNCGKVRDIDMMCDLLSRVVGQRMCEESSRYGMWH